MTTKTELEKEIAKNMKAENEIQERLQAKKEKLQQLKVEYSSTTDRLFASNQSLLRMKKALKQQTKDIRTETSSYIDNCVGLALCEAESAFFSEIQSELKENSEYDDEMVGVKESRDKLVLKLAEYRTCRENFVSTRKEVTNDCNRARQECLDASFYCQDIRSKLTHDLKKAQMRTLTNSPTSTRQHVKNLNDAIAIIADRVLDSRDELRGYFRNQMQKLKREQRLVQEAEDLHRQRKRDQDDINGTSTKKEIENFIKSQKIFDADKEESESGAPSSPDGKANAPEGHGRFAPKPPQASNMPMNISPRAGSLIGASARSHREARSVQWAAVNVDSLAEDLVLMCQLQGKKHRLETMKSLLQTNNLYLIALLQFIRDTLVRDMKSEEEGHKERKAKRSKNQHQEDIPQSAPAPPSTGPDGTATFSPRGPRVKASGDSNGAQTSKRKKRVVRVGPALLQGVDECEVISQYIANGLTYAQSLCSENQLLEKTIQLSQEENMTALISQCSHEPSSSRQLVTNSTEGAVPRKGEVTSLGDDEPSTVPLAVAESANTEKTASLPSPPTARVGPAYRKTGFEMIPKTKTSPEAKIGVGMQSVTVAELHNKQEREKARDRLLSTNLTDEKSNGTTQGLENVGLGHWVTNDKYKALLVDILVAELNATKDTPVELGMAKIASMSQIAASDSNDPHADDASLTPQKGSVSAKNAAAPVSTKTSYASQHRNVQIQGMSALNIS